MGRLLSLGWNGGKDVKCIRNENGNLHKIRGVVFAVCGANLCAGLTSADEA